MADALEWQYLPDCFIGRAQNAYKLLLFKFLLDETLLVTPQRYELRYVVARMLFDAWPILIERKLSFGIQDKFLSVCNHIEKKLNASDRPSVYFIAQCLKDGLFSPFLNDMKLNFSRFTSCWEEDRFCPYKLSGCGKNLYLETKSSWIDYCFPLIEHCRAMFYDAMLFFLCKRNKNVGNVSEYLKNCFGEPIVCTVLQEKNGVQQKDCVSKKKKVTGLSEEDYDCLNTIPIDFLFQAKDCIGCCTQLLILEKMHPCDINVVADVFDADLFKRKWLADIVDFVKDNCSKIISFFKYYSNTVEIPNEIIGDVPLGLSTKLFIEEYVDRINYKLSLMSLGRAVEGKRKRLDFFSIMYDSRNIEQETISSLAKKNNCSRERARQILLGDDDIGLNICTKILKGLDSTKNFSLNPSFQADFMELELSEEFAFPQEQFDMKYGIVDDKTRRFLFDVTEWKCSNSMPSYIGPIVYRNCDLKKVYEALSDVRKLLDEKIIPISLEEEIVPQIMDHLDLDNQTINVVCDIIRKSDSFEKVLFDDGKILYTLKWQYLCSVPSRLARILYEFRKPTHLKDVYVEYNKRAKVYGVPAEDDLNWFKMRPHRYIKSVGRLGTWEFSLDEEPEKKVHRDIISFLEEYIKENKGFVYFDKAVDHLRKSGYSHTENSIRVYLGNLCRTVKNTSGNVFVYKPWVTHFENIDVSTERNKVKNKAIPIFIETIKEKNGFAFLCELKDAYFKRIGENIGDTTAKAILEKNNELFIKERINASKVRYGLKACGTKVNSSRNQSSPKFHEEIRERIRTILKNTDGHSLRMNLIAKDVYKLVPKEKHSNIVYTIIRNMDDVEMYEVEGKKFLRLKN